MSYDNLKLSREVYTQVQEVSYLCFEYTVHVLGFGGKLRVEMSGSDTPLFNKQSVPNLDHPSV